MSDIFTEWKKREENALLSTYSKFPLALVRGKGMYVYDAKGRAYLDFYGGHAVALIGHCHPHLVSSLKSQVENFIFYSNLCYLPLRTEAAEKLLSVLYPEMDRVFFVNSGAEANEGALKLARKHTGRTRIVSMQNSFHGRTAGALSVTGIEKYRSAFTPNLAEHTSFVPFGDTEAFQRIDPGETAAVILEPIQSMAGAVTAPAGYFHSLRKFTAENGICLIFDEIQTAIGRTGEYFAGMNWDVSPDIVTMAKGIGGGIPVGAIACNGEIASKVKTGEHGTTFGGGPVACAALKATVEVLENENLVENAKRTGTALRSRLQELPGVREVRGLGLLIGFVMDRPAKEIRNALLSNGILVGSSVDPDVIRLLPPLTAGEKEVNSLIKALREISS